MFGRAKRAEKAGGVSFALDLKNILTDKGAGGLWSSEECLGEVVSLKLRIPMGDRRNFKGKVLVCETGNLTLEIDNQTHVLAIANIEKGNLVPSFD